MAYNPTAFNPSNIQKQIQSSYNNGNAGVKSAAQAQAQSAGVNINQTANTPATGTTPSGGYQKLMDRFNQDKLRATTPSQTSPTTQKSYYETLFGSAPSQTQSAPKPTAPVISNNPSQATTVSFQTPSNWLQDMTPQEAMKYSGQMAQNQYDNERLGLTQLIDQFTQQKGQLSTDSQITDKANLEAFLKYASQFDQLNTSRTEAGQNHDVAYSRLQDQFADSQKNLYNSTHQQRQAAKENIAARGLMLTSVMDDRMGGIDRDETAALGGMIKDKDNNLADLDLALNQTLAELNTQQGTLTAQRAAELQARVGDLQKARDDEQQHLDQLIQQQYQLMTQSAKNMGANQSKTYLDLAQVNGANARDDRNFAEQQRQFNVSQANDLAKAKSYSSGYGGYGGYGSTTPLSALAVPSGGTPKVPDKPVPPNKPQVSQQAKDTTKTMANIASVIGNAVGGGMFSGNLLGGAASGYSAYKKLFG